MLFFAGSGQKFQVTTYRTRLVEAKRWTLCIQLSLILDKRNRSFSQASILGKIIELVCEAIVLELVSVSNERCRKSRTLVTRGIKSRA